MISGVMIKLMEKIQYYKAVAGNTLLGVSRHRTTETREWYELWTGQSWANSRTLIDALGLGGDSPYIPISEAEARELMKQVSTR